MDLIKMLLEAQNGGLLKQVASRSGVDEKQASSAVSELLPSLAQGMQSNIAKPGGLEGLLSAIQSGNHKRYIDNPDEIANQASIDDGNSILGHILGSKDRSREVAAQAAQKTGIDVGILKSMLPMIAAAMMGGISKQAGSSGLGRQPDMPSQSGGALDQLGGAGNFGAILGKMLKFPGQPSPAGRQPQAQPQARAEPQRKRGLLDIVGRFFK